MAVIECFGVITEDFASDLRKAINAVPAADPIDLRIASPGGLLHAGITCHNLLASSKRHVNAYLEGDVFSAGTLLVCAADYAEAPSNALMMIHDPWIPPTSEMVTLATAERDFGYLKATKDQVLGVYAGATKQPRNALSRMMQVETYLDAEAACRMGFINNVISARRDVQNGALEEYTARDRDKLAQMLGARHVPVDVDHLKTKYGVK